jgi:hypothetical protein
MSNIKIVPPGNYNLKIPKSVSQVALNKLYLQCQTSGGAITISLPKINSVPDNVQVWGFHIYIADSERNAAVNNITIVAAVGDIVYGGAAVVINTDGGVAEIFIAGFETWGCLLGPSGGGGSSSLSAIYFTTIGGQNDYVFDGTPTAWNPGGLVNLLNKNISFYSSSGFIQTPSANPTIQYSWDPLTATLSIVGTVYPDGTGGLFYQT